MKKTAFLIIAFSLVLLAGCSGPATSEFEQALSKQIDSASGGQIKLTDFKKTNGEASNADGSKTYVIDFEGEITMESDGIWYVNNVWAGSGLTFTFTKKAVGFAAMNGGTQVHAGDKVKIRGTMRAAQRGSSDWTYGLENCARVSP